MVDEGRNNWRPWWDLGYLPSSCLLIAYSFIVAAAAVVFSVCSLSTIKLGTYDGSTPLEAPLAKLENCAEYYDWTGRDRLCHLKASLDGQAGQVLWQLKADATEVDVVKLLRNRFGNVNQTERFRAELQSRSRKKGESVQSVYND